MAQEAILLTTTVTGLHLWGAAHQTFLNTQITLESRVKVLGRGEVGNMGYQPNIYAYFPIWYKELKTTDFPKQQQQAQDPFIGAFRLPRGNNNES